MQKVAPQTQAASKTKNGNAERTPQAAPGVAVFSRHHSPLKGSVEKYLGG